MTASQAWQALAGDATGRLYGVVQASSSGQALIAVAALSPEALSGGSNQDAASALTSLDVTQLVATSPPLDFAVTAAAASPNGHSLLLVGVAQQDDAEVPVLAVVDLYGSQPAAASGARGGSSSSAYPGAQQRVAGLFHVHRGLYGQRPGMRILQASWHPASASHFAALSTDNRWRLYHTAQLGEAEQTFWLKLPGTQATMGLLHRRGPRGAGLPPRLTAFAFGPPAAAAAGGSSSSSSGWAALAVFFLASDGGVYLLCPVAPFGLRLRAAAVRALPGIDARGTVHAWLLAAFLEVLSNEGAAAVAAAPHALETLAPALHGPLNPGAASLKPCSASRVACTLALSSSSGSGSSEAAGGGCFAALLTGFSCGSVYAHALELGQVLPCWQDATPQIAYDSRGEVAAVRYEVEAVPVQPSTAASGLGSVPEDGISGSSVAAPTLTSPLLLLDALKINLHRQAQQEQHGRSSSSSNAARLAAAAGQGSSRARRPAADSDEESDAGYDPSAAPGQQQQLGLSSRHEDDARLHESPWDDEEEDEEDDDAEEEQLSQLRKVTLLCAPDLPGRYWACHDQGAWGINVKWLAALNSSSSGGGGAALAFEQQQQLPPPALLELFVSRAGVTSCCVVGNALLGSGAVALEAGPGPQGLGPALMLLKPRPAGVLGDGLLGAGGQPQQQQLEGGGGGGGDDDGGLGQGGPGGASLAQLAAASPEDADIQARIEEYYAEVTRGPRRLQPPPKPANLAQLTPADPAGLQYLHAATSWLCQAHVVFGAGAAADMLKRVNDLHELVSDQEQAVVQLRSLAAAAVARQAELQARIDRLSEASGALAERGRLLASLHWGMPRPPSRAEQRLDKQLEVWEKRCDETRQSWSALCKRIDGISAEARKQAQAQPAGGRQAGSSSSSSSGAFRGVPALAAARAHERAQLVKPSAPGPLAAAQLARVKEQLAAQHSSIAHASADLDALASHLACWRAEHPEMELPARLARMRAV